MPERDQVVDLHAHLVGPPAEVLVHELEREAVDARRHGRVGGEDAAGPHRLDRLGVGQALVDHELADALEAEEAGVALVGVEHLRLDAHGLQRPHAADAEQDLLAQPVLGVAAVEAVGDLADLVGVLVDVGVEEVQRHPSRARLPHLGDQRHAGQVDLHPHPSHGVSAMTCGSSRIALLLPAVGVEALAEVAVPVEQADADEGHAEVAGRLEVVARQHAEAAGVLRDGLGDAELGREVGDQVERAVALGLEPAVAVEVALQLAVHFAQEPLEPGVAARAWSRSGGTRPSRRTGSCTLASHRSGSTQRNRSRVWSSHDHRRLKASSSRTASSAGRDGRTVKLRMAFINRAR